MPGHQAASYAPLTKERNTRLRYSQMEARSRNGNCYIHTEQIETPNETQIPPQMLRQSSKTNGNS